MSKTLKYQELIDEYQLKIKCPCLNAKEMDMEEIYRWCTSPVEAPVNYMPNHAEYKAKGKKLRRFSNDDEDGKCSYCGTSYHVSLKSSKTKYAGLLERSRQLLGYTHIAKGHLVKNDGIVTPIISSHFMLYEYIDIDLSERFKIVDTL